VSDFGEEIIDDLTGLRDESRSNSSATDCYAPSVGAQMWVQVAKDFGSVIKLLSADDQSIALELIPILWSDDEDEVSAAANTLYELIDDPPISLIRVL
jgi:hypothetical protein